MPVEMSSGSSSGADQRSLTIVLDGIRPSWRRRSLPLWEDRIETMWLRQASLSRFLSVTESIVHKNEMWPLAIEKGRSVSADLGTRREQRGIDARADDRSGDLDDLGRLALAPDAAERVDVHLDARPAELEEGCPEERDAVVADGDRRRRLEQGHEDRRPEVAGRVRQQLGDEEADQG
jgi:hypothetical protein